MDNVSKNDSNLVSAITYDPVEVGGCFLVSTKARKRRYSPSGSRFHKIFAKSYSDITGPGVKQINVEDRYNTIQLASKGIEVKDLIDRFMKGDLSAIGEPLDSYADISSFPTDFLGVHQKLEEMENKFYSLSAADRSRFGNNFKYYLNCIFDPDHYKPKDVKVDPSVAPLTSDEITKIRSTIGGAVDA